MFNQFRNWLNRRFSNPELVVLLFSIFLLMLFLHFLGALLAPVFAAIIIAYLLDGMVKRLVSWKMPHILAASLVCLLFIGIFLLALFVIFPLVWQQLINLFSELPGMFKRGEQFLMHLPQRYPDFVSTTQIQNFMSSFQSDLSRFGKVMIKYSLTTIFSLITLIVYCVLVPLMVFFILKDRDAILQWFSTYMPRKRRLIQKVWGEVNDQIGNYIRAKVFEIIIVAVVTGIAFSILGLNYSLLLAVIVGLSVLIPFAGVIVVTIPVVIIAFLQWGGDAQFWYTVITYLIIVTLDGNLLAPILFSETMQIHPVAVIIAVIIFGGLWGFWGIFFAIPLATLVKAILNVWQDAGENEAANGRE